MKKDLRSTENLPYENFNLQDTRLEKILVETFDKNIILEDPKIEGMYDLKKFVKNNFGEKI